MSYLYMVPEPALHISGVCTPPVGGCVTIFIAGVNPQERLVQVIKLTAQV